MTVELRCGVSRARASTSVPNGTDVEATSLTERAEAAVAETPEDTNVAIAKRLGVSEMAVRSARKASTTSSRDEMSSRTKRAKGFLLWSGQSNFASYYVAQAGADLDAGRSPASSTPTGSPSAPPAWALRPVLRPADRS
ncbi:hypothetical protein [Bradyrhizobium sp. 155]|uniref:hypothetical protein n=1 Tax=Bradyrhizobium sp. 155 TaxID=2782629 RepID=UPI001FFE6CF2|nr:hypothetical protein [Bradyrhizobium sp. 155]